MTRIAKHPADYLLPDIPQPQPGPKWLSMSPRERRKWEDKQWTDPDADYDGPPLITPPSRPYNWATEWPDIAWLAGIVAIYFALGLVLHLNERQFPAFVLITMAAYGIGTIEGKRKADRDKPRK